MLYIKPITKSKWHIVSLSTCSGTTALPSFCFPFPVRMIEYFELDFWLCLLIPLPLFAYANMHPAPLHSEGGVRVLALFPCLARFLSFHWLWGKKERSLEWEKSEQWQRELLLLLLYWSIVWWSVQGCVSVLSKTSMMPEVTFNPRHIQSISWRLTYLFHPSDFSREGL